MWPCKEATCSSALEGLGVLQKVREEESLSLGGVGIRPKALEDSVGVEKGPKGQEAEHRVF